MAIEIAGAKVGMLVQALSQDTNKPQVDSFKDTIKKRLLHRYPNGTIIGKIVKIDSTNNTVRVQLKTPLKERLIIKHSFAYLDPKDLLVVSVQVTLPTNIAELKAMYVLKGKTNILVRRSPINGTAFAKVQGNQMVRVTGKAKQGFTEVVTDNGNGWISTQFLTTTKPVTVVTPQPPVPQPPSGTTPTTPIAPVEPGIIYVPVEKPTDVKGNIIMVALAAVVTFIAVKIFKKKSNKPL